jgi:acyl carrier protein
MSETENRLLRCFMAVFPGLTPEEIRATSAQSESVWDSLSTVTLAAVVQEEFNVEIDPEILPDLDSFEAFFNYLRRVDPADKETQHL